MMSKWTKQRSFQPISGKSTTLLLGSVVLGGLILAKNTEVKVQAATPTASENPASTTNELTTTTTYSLKAAPTDLPTSPAVTDSAVANSDSTSETPVVPTTTAAPTATVEPTVATEPQVKVSNIKLSKDHVYESDGTDINITFDWEATGISEGYRMVTPLSEAFDSITKNVVFTFGTEAIPKMGTMTLDYDNHQLITQFDYPMNPLKIYRGRATIGTFINRNYFTELDGKKNVVFEAPGSGQIMIPLQVTYDETKDYSTPGREYNVGVVYVAATHQKLNEDGSQSNVTWHGMVNASHQPMTDLALYASPQLINHVYRASGTDPQTRVTIDFNTQYSHPFTMLPDSFGIYEVEMYPSLGYNPATLKKLELGKDYEIIPGIPGDPNGFIFRLIGDYATTTKSLIMEGTAHYEDLQPDSTEVGGSTVTQVQGSAALSYLDQSGRVQTGDYSAIVELINSEMTSITADEDPTAKGSVIVSHVAGDTGKLLKAEEYVVQDGTPGDTYTTEVGDFTKQGYEFSRMGYLSAPQNGVVKKGVQHVTYVYMPIAKTGSVDVKHVDTEGNLVPGGALKTVKDAVPAGERYETDKLSNLAGYRFVGMAETSAAADGFVVGGQTLHVIYVYEKLPAVATGNVDVTHQTIDGTILQATQKYFDADQPVGTAYTTAEGKFAGYHLVGLATNSATASGVVTTELQHVIYLYAPNETTKTGSVYVKHVDRATGQVIPNGGEQTAVKENDPVGENYQTQEREFAGYEFVGLAKESAPAVGIVAEGSQYVIYLYDRLPAGPVGSVDMIYLAEDGTVLKDVTMVKTDAAIGEEYMTTQEEFAGYTFDRMGTYSAAPNGTVAEGLQHVIYLYKANPTEQVGSVDVKYVTKDGKVLKDTEVKVKDQPVGSEYGTDELAFDGYHFVGMAKDSDPAAGIVTAGTKHVIYVYEADPTPEVKKGSVDVVYLAEDGTVLKAVTMVKTDATIGEAYTTMQEEFAGYTFDRMGTYSAAPNGTVAEGLQHVIYLYKANPTEQVGSVDVKYVTKDGKVLKDTEVKVKDQPVGSEYGTDELAFDGYHFVGMAKDSDPAAGIVTAGTKHVIYVYEADPTPEVKKGSVDVVYLAEDGTVLKAVTMVKTDATIGEAYTTMQEEFAGYTFDRMGTYSAAPNGTVTEGLQHVVYIYKQKVEPPVVKTGNVSVKYVDEQGRIIPGGGELTSVKEKTPVGEEYTTVQKDFAGYEFVGMAKDSAPANGVVREGDQTVIYVYRQLPTPEVQRGTVDVTYLAEDGTVLAPTSIVKADVPVGETYVTTQKAFAGYEFVRLGAFSAPTEGQVAAGLQHVIYVYKKVTPPTPEVQRGTVTVEYVDEHGNPLPGGERTTVKDQVPVGENYTTTARDFAGYTLTGMGAGSGAPNGTVVEGTTRVIYVYTKTPLPEPNPTPTPQPPAPTVATPTPTVTPLAPKATPQQLPQTGTSANWAATFGLALLGLTAWALPNRKRKNQK